MARQSIHLRVDHTSRIKVRVGRKHVIFTLDIPAANLCNQLVRTVHGKRARIVNSNRHINGD